MKDDNIGNYLHAEDFDANNDERSSDQWKPVWIHGNELFNKAIDILNLTRTICDLLPDDDEGEMTRHLMLENAMQVPPKIKGALAVNEVYSIVMENAVIIKVNICQLKNQLWSCIAVHNIEEKYTDILKDEIDAFKKIFILWVMSFDRENDLPDEWHLFNDPATFPEDDEISGANDIPGRLNPKDE